MWRMVKASSALGARVELWERAVDRPIRALPPGVAFLMRTSGSTSKSKVVLMPREGAAALRALSPDGRPASFPGPQG